MAGGGDGSQRAGFISSIQRFGQRLSSVTSFATVWSVPGKALPDYRNVNSPDYIQVAGVNAADTSSGTGMRAIRIIGLNENLAKVTETVWLNGTTPNTTSNMFLRINRAFGLFAGSNGTNVGSIFIGYGTFTSGVPANILGTIAAGDGQTDQLTISIPTSIEIHIHTGIFMSGRTGGGQDILSDFRIRSRDLDVSAGGAPGSYELGPWRTRLLVPTIADVEVSDDTNAIIIKGPSDVIVDAKGSAAAARQAVNISYEEHKMFQGSAINVG